ncbi:hypothetical protein FisN_4Hh114 [Fistulifera solaris]|uniref:Uncharacterized protein n=1 Tax=Fistulifera solaris TaxID=1519565 RepID=A0A1Z5KEI3_FISSO|nr:hypothetical protein FisN_4Hh114 [Fistulifera solaris]|eukprot:GAX24596.1 hypothetical protein FisN_4Hh114 [Fistulifera solaris]
MLIAPVFSYESRVLGDIEMRLGSTSSSDKNELLFEILTLTVGFLDDKLSQNFADDSSVDFDKVSLSAMSYDITEVHDGYVASMTLTGRAFFTEGTSPSQQEVIDMTSQIFQEENQDYLASLMVSSNVFLQDTQYAIVRVDGNVVSENRGQDGSNTFSMDSWIVLLVGGATGFLVVLTVCLLWYCCSYVNSEEPDAVVRKTPSKATKNTAEEDESLNERSQTPSPVRSISSQDSSVFTYNPKSSKSVDSKTFGSFLTNNTGSEIDVEAWQKGSKVHKDNSIFGHDISEIENKKDLSLIEEGSDEENTPDKRRPGASYLAKYQQGNLQAARPSAGSHTNSIRRSSFSSSSVSSSSSRANKRRNIDLEADAEELINDLKDLSVQINRYRNG